MRIDIISVVPELLESPLGHSIVGRAIRKGLVEIHVHNPRKYGKGPHQQVDDYSYGGDAGMVMMVEPLYKMITELCSERDYDEIIYMSPGLRTNSLSRRISYSCAATTRVLTTGYVNTWSRVKFPSGTMYSAAARYRRPSLRMR